MEFRDLRRGDLSAIEWTGSPRHLAYVSEALDAVDQGLVDLVVVWDEDEVVGIGGVDFRRRADAGHLWMLNIRESRRGSGLGTQLVHVLEERISRRGLRVAMLSVENENVRARALYERLGYTSVGNAIERWEVDEPAGGGVTTYTAHCTIMRKDLTRIGSASTSQ